MKLEEIKKLDNKDLIISVVEFLGWKTITTRHGTAFFKDGCAIPYTEVPKYPNDLNACADFESSMDENGRCEYLYALGEVIYGLESNRNDWREIDMVMASPRQKSEAFLFCQTEER